MCLGHESYHLPFITKSFQSYFSSILSSALKDKKAIKARRDSRIDKSIDYVRSPMFPILDFWLDVVVMSAYDTHREKYERQKKDKDKMTKKDEYICTQVERILPYILS